MFLPTRRAMAEPQLPLPASERARPCVSSTRSGRGEGRHHAREAREDGRGRTDEGDLPLLAGDVVAGHGGGVYGVSAAGDEWARVEGLGPMRSTEGELDGGGGGRGEAQVG